MAFVLLPNIYLMFFMVNNEKPPTKFMVSGSFFIGISKGLVP